VDPYQPAEESVEMMPRILNALSRHPPKVFVIQTRGPLIVRDLAKLVELAGRTTLRVSFSITTNREPVRKLFEPHCATIACRLKAIRALREAGLVVFATIAPILPCDPEDLAGIALEASDRDVIGDPLHIRSAKPHGATTREAAFGIANKNGFAEWLRPEFQREVVDRIGSAVRRAGRSFAIGTEGFGWLAQS
jgi:DNA repair photolyase